MDEDGEAEAEPVVELVRREGQEVSLDGEDGGLPVPLSALFMPRQQRRPRREGEERTSPPPQQANSL